MSDGYVVALKQGFLRVSSGLPCSPSLHFYHTLTYHFCLKYAVTITQQDINITSVFKLRISSSVSRHLAGPRGGKIV
jgi:hypothetical protein